MGAVVGFFMNEHLEKLERRVSEIETRNARVEKDKAWETSFTRIVVVSFLTYFVTVLVFWMLGSANFFLNALVPTIGFILSVQSVPMLKTWWTQKR